MTRHRENYFVYIEPDGRVTVPDWKEDCIIFDVEISKETVRDWPIWLRGMYVKEERIVW